MSGIRNGPDDSLAEPPMIDRGHQVPFGAGASKDGKTVYIDERLPATLELSTGTMSPDPHLVTHELVEHNLMQDGEKYPRAHDLATRAEHASVAAAGHRPQEYEAALQPHLKGLEEADPKRIPKDLYKKPYMDNKHDKKLVGGKVPGIAEAALKPSYRINPIENVKALGKPQALKVANLLRSRRPI
jgi:hypothetical protein